MFKDFIDNRRTAKREEINEGTMARSGNAREREQRGGEISKTVESRRTGAFTG